jgi:hypothetical protein
MQPHTASSCRTAGEGSGRYPGTRSRTSGRARRRGIDQVGCVDTARGLEFDYVGVIFGPDLVYRPMDGGWVGQRDQSSDRVVRSGVTDAEFTASWTPRRGTSS